MLANQLTGFGAQLEDREGRGVVQIERLAFHDIDLRIESFGILFAHLSGLDLVAFQLAYVHNQTVHELHVTHLQREDGGRDLPVYRHIFRHREHKSGLTHRRTCCNDYEVRRLPTRSDLIQGVESRRNTGDRTGVLGRFLHTFESLLNHRVYLRHVAFLRALRDLKNPCFRRLHQLIYILGLIESHLFYLRCECDHIARSSLLRNDFRVVTQVCRRGYTAGQISQIDGAAGFLQRA